ncbi:MAG: flagellar basal body-associated FliL family protein [Micavibrio aeruginosavorus]|uniref:Flagellar basal body-associated FliL family protein n=1 Tax=Micavibrio aeruginosavorus TaxID=349221 RepID=A0A2W5PMA7_9BACT|nr:MAG: flagellar basal body-associated FliL family protein [Micavibrio aeruginosavorus]
MKLAVIALLAVVLLGGGAAGAYFYLNKPAVASAGPVDEVKKAEHEAKTEEAAEGAAAPKEQFVRLDALIFPIIGDSGVTQTVSLVVSIEVPDEATAKEVERLSPRLRDAFIQDMYGMLNRKNSMNADGLLQVNAIKDRLNKISVKVLGKDNVNDVLLQIVQQRRV